MSLIVKTGGGGRGVGLNAGIHWHMILSAQVTYVSTDPQLQVIPWFKVHRSDGTEAEYVTLDDPPDAATLGTLPQHQLTCIDCHNRPSHVYQPPDTSTDRAMANGSIPASLPFIKQTAVEALLKDWPDKEAAHRGLADDIQGFYRDRYPEVAQKNQDQIQKAVESVTSIYDHSVFPEMRVNWASYASNIGHRNWPGCFRCHDGRHVRKDDGTPLSRDCTICHTLPQRGPLAPLAMTAPAADVNWHVWELKGKHEKMQCVRCHAVGKRPAPTCAECHKLDAKAPMMGSCSDCHEKAQEVKPLVACTDCHDSLGGLHAKGGHPDAPCLTCHKLHVWKPAADRSLCLTCHKDYTNHHADGGACMSCHAFRK